MELRSVTLLPEVLLPKKKPKALPTVEFVTGLSLDLKILLKTSKIWITSLSYVNLKILCYYGFINSKS